MIPVNQPCQHCGTLTWREEMGVADRYWDGGFVCKAHVKRYELGFLVSPQGHVEYNAEFVLGKAALLLVDGRWYTNQELSDICGGALFLKGSSQCVERNISKWRYERQSK